MTVSVCFIIATNRKKRRPHPPTLLPMSDKWPGTHGYGEGARFLEKPQRRKGVTGWRAR
ncbi:MAG: hypothetical protein ACLUE2_09070 [Bacteroides cellulosilyticus]